MQAVNTVLWLVQDVNVITKLQDMQLLNTAMFDAENNVECTWKYTFLCWELVLMIRLWYWSTNVEDVGLLGMIPCHVANRYLYFLGSWCLSLRVRTVLGLQQASPKCWCLTVESRSFTEGWNLYQHSCENFKSLTLVWMSIHTTEN